MGTPLHDFIGSYLRQEFARCHTPGHKGRLAGPLEQAALWDITELRGADSLYHADGPLAEMEQRYTTLYQTAGSFLSAGGSTLCIQAMLALVRPLGRRVLMGRNVHLSAVNAMALLGLEPVWLYPDQTSGAGYPGTVSPAQVEQMLGGTEEVAAVYLTSPDYFGVISDIAGVAAVCRRFGVPLLVDNAHGAHLAFGEQNLHPIHQGADLCCDSLHKTLPVLTGGALLHVGNPRFSAGAKEAMALFGSTSPSYLVMLSADELLPWLEGEGPSALCRTAEQVAHLQSLAKQRGFSLPTGPALDPTRLVLGHGALGMGEAAFDQLLTHWRIEPEYQAEQACVFLFSPHNRAEDFQRVAGLIQDCVRQGEPLPLPPPVPHPEQVLPLRDAVLSPRETLPVEQAVGRIAAAVVSRCPPGIPLLVPGERVDEFMKSSLLHTGISSITVVL